MSTSSSERATETSGVPQRAPQGLTLELDDAAYALPLDRVEEVIRMPRLGALPGAHVDVLGCLDLRGEHVLVVDLFARLGLPPAPIHPSQVLLIVSAGDSRVGLRASRVDRVVDLPVGPLPPASDDLPGVVGLLEGAVPPVALLDLDALLEPERLALSGERTPGAP